VTADTLWQAVLQLSGWEAVAMLLGVAYIILAIKVSIWAWPSAFLSTLIYTIVFWEANLPLQSTLHLYYLLMAVYGFWLWNQPHNSANETIIISKNLIFHTAFITIGVFISSILGWFNTENEFSKLPYLDSFVMVFSVMNTFLMARKVIENWLYWIVINSGAIILYWQAELYITIVLFIIYLALAIVGYKEWQKKYLDSLILHK